MKREEKYIPYKERSPKELCRDINLKAEKLFLKKDKYGLLIFTVFFLALVALHLYYKTYVSVCLGAIVVGAIVAVGFVVFKPYFSRNDNIRSLIFAVFLLVLMALNWQEKTYVNWWLGAIWVGTLVVVTAVFFIINKRLVNDMYLAANPKQHLGIAKRLKRCLQIRNILCISLLIWFPVLILDRFQGERWFIPSLIFVVLVLFGDRDLWIDIAFCEDVNELEYRLEA